MALHGYPCCGVRRASALTVVYHARRCRHGVRVVIGLLSVWLLVNGIGRAAEPAAEFLSELATRGYDDVALAYLERLEKSPSVSIEAKDLIGFQRGEVLVRLAVGQRVASRKLDFLNQAQQSFTKFIADSPDHLRTPSAVAQLGSIQLERARILVQQAKDESLEDGERADRRKQARGLFDRATKTFRQNQADLRARLEALPDKISQSKDSELYEERRRLRKEYVQAQVVLAMIPFEQSASYAPDSPRRRKLLGTAEQAFKEVSEKRRRQLAGVQAVYYRGRCRQELGDVRGALSFFEDLLLTLEDNEPLVRPWKTRALRGAMECWLDDDFKQYEAARQRAEAWISTQRPLERSDEDWLVVKLLLARTYLAIVGGGQAGGAAPELKRSARRLAIEVARYRGSSQAAAERLLADLGHAPAGDEAANSENTQVAVAKTFGEAYDAARERLSQRQLLAQEVERLKLKGTAAEFEQSQQKLTRLDASTIELLRHAMALADNETPVDQINQVRYFLCTLCYYSQDYYSAVVLADFLSSRYPSSEEGRRAISVALASLAQLYDGGNRAWSPAIAVHMRRTAERIVNQWAGQPEADEALATLATLAIRSGEMERAEETLRQISKDSPKRAVTSITVGQALWNQAASDGAAGKAADEVARLQARAVDFLEDGVKHAADLPVSLNVVRGALLVAQFWLNSGRPLEAIKLLSDDRIGPRTLADQRHPIVEQNGLREQVYMLTMLSYISALADSNDPDAKIDQALRCMDQMVAGDDQTAQGAAQMSNAYVILARRLQEQLKSVPAGQRQGLVNAFDKFLSRAAESATELSVLAWVAESYVDLAALSVEDGSNMSQDALRSAGSTYENILAGVEGGRFSMTTQERLSMLTRLAVVYRDLGDFEAALTGLASALRENPGQVYMQLEAARTLKAWGDAGRSEAYVEAITGTRQDARTGKKIIWGFGRIAKLVAPRPNLENLFFESRYQLSKCRFQYAMSKSGEKRSELLQQAERDVLTTVRFFPQQGDSAYAQQFDEVLQEIQQALGKPLTGLK